MSDMRFLDQRRGTVPTMDGVIERRFEDMVKSKPLDKYLLKGTKPTYHMPQHAGLPTKSFDIVRGIRGMVESRSTPLRILDIGAGACRPLIEIKKIYGEDVSVTAVTGHDIWQAQEPEAQ